MRIHQRVARLEARYPAPLEGGRLELAEGLDPAEHERRFGYRLITPDMTAAEAAQHYLGTVREAGACRIDMAALAAITPQAAAQLYREQLG